MSTIHTNQHEQTSTGNTAGKSSMMDDAPLFAGLADFVLVQTTKKEKKIPAAGQVSEKKKTVSRRPADPVTRTEPLPQRTPKPIKSTALDPNALLLSVIEICTLLKISRATLVRMDKAGKIPGRIKLGGSVRFHRETIDNWIQGMVAGKTI